MNRINVNQIKQVGAFTFLYFLAIGLGVLVEIWSIIKKYVLCSCLFSLVWRDDLPLLSRKKKRSWIYLYSWLRDWILLLSFASWCRGLYSSLDRRKFCGDGRLKWSFSLEFTKCLVFCHFLPLRQQGPFL